LLAAFAGKAGGLWHSYRLTRNPLPEPGNGPSDLSLERLRARLTLALASSSERAKTPLSPEEKAIVEAIRSETGRANRDNVTRTAAYWSVYERRPELHWALLAHVVSRNGGWAMTDLKGDLLPRLLDERLIESSFELLEACNSLIFGDAYPQLRLYEEGLRLCRPLLSLLPEFGVSAFMAPFWDSFLEDGDSVPLTEALIVNEQHFIQHRVVENPYFKQAVFSSAEFKAQPFLQTNQLLIPLAEKHAAADAGAGAPIRLAGRVLERFEDLRERIEFGKCLYGLLYGYPRVLSAAVAFARGVPHTGSRADYWPHRFRREAAARKKGASAKADDAVQTVWHSPGLAEAWPDRPLFPSEGRDWFRDMDVFGYVSPIRLPKAVDMTHEHLFGQFKLQEAALLELSFMKGASRRRTGLG